MNKTRVWLAVQAALCALLCAMLAWAAIGIYREGIALRAEDPFAEIYTRQKVAQRLVPIAPLCLASVALTVAGLALGLRDARADAPVRDAGIARDLIRARVRTPSATMLKERAAQARLKWGGWVGCGLCMVPAAACLADGRNFENLDLEAAMGVLLLKLVPWVAAGFACLIASAVLRERHALRELEAALAQLAAERASGERVAPVPAVIPKPGGSVAVLRAVLLLAAAGFIAAGVWNGSMRDVFIKAINICTECVGLG